MPSLVVQAYEEHRFLRERVRSTPPQSYKAQKSPIGRGLTHKVGQNAPRVFAKYIKNGLTDLHQTL